MSPEQDYFTFGIPDELKSGLQFVKDRDGVSAAEQIRRGIRMWLKSKGVRVEGNPKRGGTRKK